MKKFQTQTINLGIFVIIISILLILGIYLIGNNKSLFGSNIVVHSSFGNAAGLQKGNNVRYSGITIGTVDNIQIINDSTIQIDMRLQRDAREYVRKNAVVSIGVDGIVGSALININPGEGNASFIEEGDHLASTSLQGVEEIMNSFGQTSLNLSALSTEFLRTSKSINEGEGPVAALLSDSTFTNHLINTARNLELGTQMLITIENELKKSIDQINSQPNNLNRLLYDSTIMQSLKSVTEDLKEHVSDNQLSAIDSIAASLQHTSRNLELISQNILQFSNEMNADKNSLLYTLMSDSSSAANIQITLENLKTGSELLNEDLRALQDNFLTRRYFRKQEKAARRDSAR